MKAATEQAGLLLQKPTTMATKVENTKQRILKYQKEHGVRGVFNKAVAENDQSAVLFLMNALAKKRWERYSEACMSQFRSKQLCFSNSVPFYIWEQLEIKKMRQQMLGDLWNIYEKTGKKTVYQ